MIWKLANKFEDDQEKVNYWAWIKRDYMLASYPPLSLLESSLREEAPAIKEELLDSIDPALVECSRVSTRISSKINNVFKHLSRSAEHHFTSFYFLIFRIAGGFTI